MYKSTRSLLLPLVVGVVAIDVAPSAFAQESSQEGPAIESIVVTGSRIVRRDYVAESPIATVSTEQLQSLGGVTLDASLSQMPQLVASAGASANAFNGGGGQAKANLRGLGAQRTLVLLDGRRLPPANPDGSIDLNLLPMNVLENVEVITGGASAVYGSDAVTGVVNFKLRHNFQGIEMTAQTGVAEEGDAETTDYSVLMGGKFAEGRGSSLISLNYSERGIAHSFDRPLYGQDPVRPNNEIPEGNMNIDVGNLPSQTVVDSLFTGYGVSASVPNTSRFYFNTDGSLFLNNSKVPPVNYRGPASQNTPTGVSFNVPSVYYQTPLHRVNIYTYNEFELNPSVKLFVQAQFADYDTTGERPPNVAGSSASLTPLTVPSTNPFISSDLRSLLSSRPDLDAPFTIVKRAAEGKPIYQEWKYQVYEVVGGAEGNLPISDWTWSAFAQASKTTRNERFIDYASSNALNTLLQAPDGGLSICDGGYDPFGVNPMSQSCQDFVNRTTNSINTIKVDGLEGSLQGKLFDLPAGEARFAAGVSYRKVDFDFTPDALVASGDLAGFLPVQASQGETAAREVFTELLLPLLSKDSFVGEANLALAYRYSDHDSVGGISAYKFDLDWSPLSILRLRGGYSRGVRAPSVGELYAPQTLSRASGFGSPGPVGAGDACDVNSAYRAAGAAGHDQVRALCLAQGMPAAVVDTYSNDTSAEPALSAGNTSLEAEEADTYSVGGVIRPIFDNELFSNITLSVDYYSIELTGAAGSITSILAMQRCFNADGSNPTYDNSNYYCQLILRNPADGTMKYVLNPLFNLGGYKTTGIDISADWSIPLSALRMPDSAGRVRLSTNINHLNTFEIRTLATSPFIDYAGTIGNGQIDETATTRPTWKAFSSLNYDTEWVSIGVNWRYLGKMENADNVGTSGTLPPTKAVSYFDINATYHLNDNVDIKAGVANLLDTEPPVVRVASDGFKSTDQNAYDIIGRRYFAGVKVKF